MELVLRFEFLNLLSISSNLFFPLFRSIFFWKRQVSGENSESLRGFQPSRWCFSATSWYQPSLEWPEVLGSTGGGTLHLIRKRSGSCVEAGGIGSIHFLLIPYGCKFFGFLRVGGCVSVSNGTMRLLGVLVIHRAIISCMIRTISLRIF